MIYTITLNPTIDRTMHFPRLAIGELNRAVSSRTDLSGKGVNVTIALSRLGLESVMLGYSAGAYGRVLEQGLVDMGYVCDFVQVPGETRSNVTVIDDATGITTKLNESGPQIDEAGLRAFEQRLEQRLVPGDLCVFSGSLPPGAPVNTYARLITLCHNQGAVTALDTSGPAMAAGCKASPGLVKPNDIEAAEMVSMPFEIPEQWLSGVRAIQEQGPEQVFLSLGSRGAVYADSESAVWCKPPKIQEVSAIGAGDSAMAGTLWAWLTGKSAPEIARWGVAFGTAAAMQDGTAIPQKEQVCAVYEKTTVIAL